jgi:hypothetical protein
MQTWLVAAATEVVAMWAEQYHTSRRGVRQTVPCGSSLFVCFGLINEQTLSVRLGYNHAVVLSELSSRHGTNKLYCNNKSLLSATCFGRATIIGYASFGISLHPCAYFCEYMADDGRKTETCSIIMRRQVFNKISRVFAVARLVEALR